MRFTLIAVAAFPILAQACSPLFDEDYYMGFLPPGPCWLEQDPACRSFIREGSELIVDPETNQVTVTGVTETCAETIAEELAREEDGRKTYGWLEEHGQLEVDEEGVLTISEMTDEALERYSNFVYLRDAE